MDDRRHLTADDRTAPRLRVVAERCGGPVDLAVLALEARAADDLVWLDSAGASGPRARWSVLGFADGPFGIRLTVEEGRTVLDASEAAAPWFDRVDVAGRPFFPALQAVLDAVPVPPVEAVPGCPFALGWVGFVGYESDQAPAERDGRDDAGGPDACLRFVDRAVVVDHAEGASWVLSLGGEDSAADAVAAAASGANARWAARTSAALRAGTSGAGQFSGGASGAGRSGSDVSGAGGSGVDVPDSARPSAPARGRVRRAAYESAVEACREEIRHGNAFQVCLTTAFDVPPAPSSDPDADPFLAEFLTLRRGNGVPFGAYLRLGRVRIAGRSPERFLRIDADGTVVAEPIKGTRPRSEDPVVDAALRDDLATSPKDRAENVMIVDLLRNDLLRSAVPGSVRVERLCAVESYRSVHQLVSTVVGRVRPEVPLTDVVRHAFPPGSMTGAPKTSAMAIAARLEGTPRGPYAGVVGYFSSSGAVDLAVTIRSLVTVLDGSGVVLRRSVGTGGAVTWSSSAAGEAAEAATKARSVLDPLGTQLTW